VAGVVGHLSVGLILGLVATVCTADDRGPNTIVLIDEVRVAFHENAPRAMIASMRRAVDLECKAGVRTEPEEVNAWLCNGSPLHFVRGVDVLGNEQKTGMVCSDEGITPHLRYYTEDMFTDNPQCLPIWYSTKSKTHFMGSGTTQ
jgi:hypothetical protein